MKDAIAFCWYNKDKSAKDGDGYWDDRKKLTKKNPQRKSTEPSPLSWDLTVRSAVEIIQALLSMMTEEFYSYKNGALVFTQKAPLLFIYLNL